MTPAFIPTHLRDNDELLVPSRPASSLAQLYGNLLAGKTAEEDMRAIVAGNGVAWSSKDIDAWVLRTGGKRLANGQAVFTSRSIINLPAGGPRPAVVDADTPPAPAAAGGGLFLLGVGFVLWRLLRKKR